MRTLLPLFLVMIAAFSTTSVASQNEVHSDPELGLCRALEMVGPGQQIPVLVTGVMQDEYFYDPLQPTCPQDVQPSTVLVFDCELPPEAVDLLKRDRRLSITVQGKLLGPRIPADPSRDLPVALRLSNQVTSRFGFHYSFRTQLVVEAILRAEEVPSDLPWGGRLSRPTPSQTAPQITKAELPDYPWQARRLGVEGAVVLDVEVVAGQISRVQVTSSDDPILSTSAVESVSTWAFKESVSTRFKSTFQYSLERRAFPGDDNPRVEARLPSYVRIVGPTLDW